MGGIHNTRIIRFLAVLGAVIITIFIYASYSTNTSLTPPPHMRAAASGSSGLAVAAAYQQQMTVNSSEHKAIGIEERSAGKLHSGAAGSGGFSGNSIHKSSHSDKANGRKTVAALAGAKKTHREPTIDADAGDGGAGSSGGVGAAGGSETDDDINMERYNEDEQYVQNIENIMGNVNSSSGGAFGSQQQLSQQQAQTQSLNQQNTTIRAQAQQAVQQQQNNVQSIAGNLNKISDSDVLIPTSNLQKFIENADKILKNITVASPATSNDIITNKESEQQPQGAQADQRQQQQSQENVLSSSHEHKNNVKQSNSGANTNNNIKNAPAVEGKNNEKENEIDSGGDDGEPLPPSVVMTIKRTNAASVDAVAQKTKDKSSNTPSVLSGMSQAKSKVPAKINTSTPKAHGMDPLKGIPTRELYESGHLNEEVDIERLCPNDGASLRVLILITSALEHGPARLAIRQTWGHYGVRRDVSMAFVVGRTTNETINEMLSKENYIYGDLIRGNFIDSYNNLTLKTISSLEWVDEHCSHAKYILKTDDDMFINVPKLLSFLDAHANDKRVIFGRLAKKWKPIRNKKSKYFVSTGQFSAAVFPPFTTGPAYVLSNDIVHDLYVHSLNQVYLKLEDVFTTGIVAQQLNIKRAHAYEFLNRRISFNPCNLRKAISVHMVKSNEQFDLWKKLLDQTTRCK